MPTMGSLSCAAAALDAPGVVKLMVRDPATGTLSEVSTAVYVTDSATWSLTEKVAEPVESETGVTGLMVDEPP